MLRPQAPPLVSRAQCLSGCRGSRLASLALSDAGMTQSALGASGLLRPATGRQPCGGASTVFLGSDASEWTTNSSAHGVGGAEAVASAELRVRQAVGGKDSISFGSEAAAAGASTTPRSARVATSSGK